LYQKKALPMKWAHLSDMFKKRPPGVSVHQTLYFTPTSSALKTQENTVDDTDECEAADEGDIPVEYYSDQLYSPSLGAGTKSYL